MAHMRPSTVYWWMNSPSYLAECERWMRRGYIIFTQYTTELDLETFEPTLEPRVTSGITICRSAEQAERIAREHGKREMQRIGG